LHTTDSQARALFSIYALGLIGLSAEILFLYCHAWRLRGPLRLNDRERFMTRAELMGWSIPISLGTVSLVLALTLPTRKIEWAGWIYFSMFILVPSYRWFVARKRPPI
jgi:hypothetical protein